MPKEKLIGMPMSILEMLNVLGKTKTANPPKKKWEEPVHEPIDWTQRNKTKSKIFFNHLLLLGIIVAGLLLLMVLPVWLGGSTELSRAVLLPLPIMLFITLTWMVPAWKFFDRKALLWPITLGMMPLRILIAAVFVKTITACCPELSTLALILAMMIYWALFAVPEFGMLCQFAKLERTAEDEPT